MKCNYQIIANNKDVTHNFKKAGLLSMRIRDMRGTESDDVEIAVNDVGSCTHWVTQGAELKVAIGFGNKLYDKGKYIVDQPKHDGPPDKIIITARAADLLKSLKRPKRRSWNNTTLGEILTTIASEHNLRPAITQRFHGVVINHIDQHESDMHFVTRLSRDYDAVAKPAGGALIFVPKGEKLTASGQTMPVFNIDRSETSRHSYIEKARSDYTGVEAAWNDRKYARLRYELAGETGNVKRLTETKRSQRAAQDAAQSEYKALMRDGSTMDIDLKKGRPELIAESEINLSGWRKEMLKPWVSKGVEHNIDAKGGLTGRVQMELPNS